MELPCERSGFCAGILAHLLITSFSAASVHFAKRCTILNQQGLKKITYTKKNIGVRGGGEVFFPVGEYENVVWDRGGAGGLFLVLFLH